MTSRKNFSGKIRDRREGALKRKQAQLATGLKPRNKRNVRLDRQLTNEERGLIMREVEVLQTRIS